VKPWPRQKRVAVRAENALKGIVGKRLMYRRPDEAEIN
jgi:hypothetical protein